jgi:hypothetical protein
MDRIKLVIFSLNRAQQLDALLRSVDRNAKDIFSVEVLYKAIDEEFNKGYEILKKRHPNVKFLLEGKSFRETLTDLLTVVQHFDKYKYVAFMTDDCLVYRNIAELTNYHDIDDLFEETPPLNCVSLRLGENITVQTYWKNDLLKPLTSMKAHEFRIWNAQKHLPHSHYGYIYSVDGHIFRCNDIIPLIETTDFNNPNSLESNISENSHKVGTKPYMASLEKQSVVAIPANIVNEAWNNKHGVFHGFSPEELNNKFLSGQVIDLDHAERWLQDNCNCTHIEVPYEFVQTR